MTLARRGWFPREDALGTGTARTSRTGQGVGNKSQRRRGHINATGGHPEEQQSCLPQDDRRAARSDSFAGVARVEMGGEGGGR